MSKIKTVLALGTLAVASLLSVQPAMAYGHDGWGYHHGHGHHGGMGIDARQERQEHRIREGYRSGELTRREAIRLEREQAYIRYAARQARADGYLSHEERARLHAMQNQAGQHIRQERHDNEYRRW